MRLPWSSSVALAVALFAFAAPSLGDDPVAEARAHFEAGARLEHDGRFAEATKEYLRADELVKDDEILRAALECATHVDPSDVELAIAVMERSRGRTDATVADLAKKARTRAGASIVEVSATCGGCGAKCVISIDGRDVAPGPRFVAASKPHAVDTTCVRGPSEAQCREPSARSSQRVLAEGEVIDPSRPCTPPAATPPSPPPQPFVPELRRDGLHPAVFFIGAGLTALAGAGTIVSGLDANGLHDDFVARGCDRVGAPGCGALANDGDGAVLRTNVLVAVTATLGVSTAIVGAFFTGWRLKTVARAEPITVGLGFGTVTIGGTF